LGLVGMVWDWFDLVGGEGGGKGGGKGGSAWVGFGLLRFAKVCMVSGQVWMSMVGPGLAWFG